MPLHRAPTPVLCLLLACGPTTRDDDDTYPRNCGVEGPVDLFELELGFNVELQRAGDHYLLRQFLDPTTIQDWAIERCGEAPVLMYEGTAELAPNIGAAGEHVLSCDPMTGEVLWLDPRDVEPPHSVFPAVEECRLVPLGTGLAAQQRGGSTVWFHPDPADPSAQPIVVTETARVADPGWIHCYELDLECKSHHPFGVDIRAAGDDLLVVLQDERLLAWSATSQSSRTLDPGPLFAMDVLPGDDRVVVSRELGPTYVVDRTTGAAIEFGRNSGYEPIQRLGDWLVQGSFTFPFAPAPDDWTNFSAYHLGTGATTTVRGTERWSPLARLTADTMLADIGDVYDDEDQQRYVVWLQTGERQPVDFPGERLWTVPGQDGVYAVVGDPQDGEMVHFLPGPDRAPEVLIEGVKVVFATVDGRIVSQPAREPGEPAPLSVMRPDGSTVQLADDVLGAFGVYFYSERWPVDRDEVVYGASEDDRWVLRRTVLP